MKKLFMLLIILFLLSSVSQCESTTHKNKSGVTEKMMHANFWITRAKNSNKILLTEEQVKELSNRIRKTKGMHCVNIFLFPEIISKERLINLLNTFKFPQEARYNGEILIDREYISNLKKQYNENAINNYNIVRFGTVVKETQIRTFPTADPSYIEPNDIEFDMNIESVLKVWEPLALIHSSLNQEWTLVQSPTCLGWVKTEDIAITTKTKLQKILNRDFIAVTGSRVTTDVDHTDSTLDSITLTMGTYLPLADEIETISNVTTQYSYSVLLPKREYSGDLALKVSRIPFSADVNKGYVQYTQKNIIKQAFKSLGERYGWGGLWKARDCSSFVRDIYLTFGIQLPRNSANQSKIPSQHYNVSEMDIKEKYSLISQQPAGALLRRKGHIMLYLGHVSGKIYVIHNAYAYGESGKKGQNERMEINSVAISDLEITLKDKATFLEGIIDVNTVAN